jgi:MFS family permease
MQTTTSMTFMLPDARRGQAIGMSNSGLTTASGVSPLFAGVLADRTDAVQAVGWFGLAGVAAATGRPRHRWRGAARRDRGVEGQGLLCTESGHGNLQRWLLLTS